MRLSSLASIMARARTPACANCYSATTSSSASSPVAGAPQRWRPIRPPFTQLSRGGKRLPASLQYAALAAGLKLRGAEDLQRGEALPGDFTGAAWRQHFDPQFTPLTPWAAGERLARLARAYDFSVFSYWWTDVVGHRGDMAAAVAQLELLDAVLAGALAGWDAARDTLILTSDHGNLEAMNHGKHTENEVPTLVFGAARNDFHEPLSLADVAPTIERILGIKRHAPS